MVAIIMKHCLKQFIFLEEKAKKKGKSENVTLLCPLWCATCSNNTSAYWHRVQRYKLYTALSLHKITWFPIKEEIKNTLYWFILNITIILINL